MDIFDQILENLELERELGTRTVEIDRALLVPPSIAKVGTVESIAKSQPLPVPSALTPQKAKSEVSPASAPQRQSGDVNPPSSASQCDIAFFTGKPLSPAGMEAMEKIFVAIRKIKSDIVVCLNEKRKAKAYVLLGADALKKYLPTAKAVRGNWDRMNGVPAVMTFSPDYIFSHFQKDSPRMNAAKLDMWNDIKSAVAMV